MISHNQGNTDQAIAVAQKSVLLEPTRLDGRRQLATLVFQDGNPGVARAVLGGTAADSGADYDEMRRSLGMRAVAAAANAEPDVAATLARKAVVLSPWDRDNWRAYAYARCATT